MVINLNAGALFTSVHASCTFLKFIFLLKVENYNRIMFTWN